MGNFEVFCFTGQKILMIFFIFNTDQYWYYGEACSPITNGWH